MRESTLLITLATAAIAISASFSALAADPIKIGSVLSISGPAALLGDPELKTLQLYAASINKAGGVLHRHRRQGEHIVDRPHRS